jgi:deoxyribodipyrimidine photo-lyase
VPWRDDKTQFRAWCEGRTGIPIIDAAMRQLTETGWMHNRLRMVTAMFLAKHLLIDWRKGEQWFMQHLVDGDFSANNGGWQWSASTGTDAVPYFRVFNPVTQSQRFDSHGEFIRRYVPELAGLDARNIHAPGLLKPSAYPVPIIDLKFGRERAIAAFKG